MTCHYDRQAEKYLTDDGAECKTDEYGDATKHCTARRTCNQHIGWDELSCARCVGRVRTDVRHLLAMTTLMLPEVVAAGTVTTEAAMYAGPAADMGEYAENREALRHRLDTWARLGRITERQQFRELADVAADDENHPANVLGVWCRMWAEDYGLEAPDTRNLAALVSFVDRVLGRVAQDEEQDFPLFAREVRQCRTRMENTLRDGQMTERGAPCPACYERSGEGAPRLVRQYAHWCEDAECERLHHATDEGDEWVCPRDRDHRWSHEDYRRWVADVYEEQRGVRS